ncbi:multiple epidermal growth factor-like domains protein 10 [Corticium candelabrum]|uniref:multiple epidermal growth factor-like domains protein 10 n=1 Tax=Corticium candelabrum TaxID=121492 RepID=UPI002E262914|nr:multiple epidermal growth factor-like domains protein 10 [Corticium candelabrum]
MYGRDCKEHCDCKFDYCDARNGTCLCPEGWTGLRCDQECPDGTFGVGCQDCQCELVDAACDKKSGCQCPSGRTGDDCQAVCEVDLYGVGCTQTCSEECLNGKCDPETGICACPEGQSWDGENCQETVVISGGSKAKDSSVIWEGVGGGAAVILVSLSIILVIVIRRRKRADMMSVSYGNTRENQVSIQLSKPGYSTYAVPVVSCVAYSSINDPGNLRKTITFQETCYAMTLCTLHRCHR